MRLRYRPRGAAHARLALVGKGICFDTGGINLKTAQEHVPHARGHAGQRRRGRHAARADAAARAVRIDCWLAITENEIGPRAYRPQEVVRARTA